MGVGVDSVNSYFSPKKRHTVRQSVRTLIQQEADRLGYVPKGRAGGLAGKTIGYQVPRYWDAGQIENVVFSGTYAALVLLGQQRNLTLRTFSGPAIAAHSVMQHRSMSERKLVEELERSYAPGRHRLDGFIFDDPRQQDSRILHAQATGLPYVVTGNPVELDLATGALRRPTWAERWPCVDVDDRAGFRDLVWVLASRGGRRLLHLGFADDATFIGLRRRQGVLDAARELNWAAPALERLQYSAAPGPATASARAFLIAHPEADAVICDCDRFAFYVSCAARDLGRVVEVAGYDNDGLRQCWPWRPWISLFGRSATRAAWILDSLTARMSAASATPPSSIHQQETKLIPPQIVGVGPDEHRLVKAAAGRLTVVLSDRLAPP